MEFDFCSTCFLIGPMKQLKNMFAEKRYIATIIVMVSFVLTLVAAIVVMSIFGFSISPHRKPQPTIFSPAIIDELHRHFWFLI